MPIGKATPSQVQAAVRALTDADSKLLARYANCRAVGLVNFEGKDLFQEAIVRTFTGNRAWNLNHSLVDHLLSAIRSICFAERRKRDNNCLSLSALSDNGTELVAARDPEQVARDFLANLKRELQVDPLLATIIDLRGEGRTAKEIQETLRISEHDYLAASKRLHRYRTAFMRNGDRNHA